MGTHLCFRLVALPVAALLCGVQYAGAQTPDDLRRAVARISYINGEVSILRGDSGEWVAGAVNAPLMANDRISTGPNSRTEIEFDSGNILRIGGGADLTIMDLEQNRYQLSLGHGMLTFRILRPTTSDIEVDTPNVSVRPSQVGSYRISVSDSGESQITARSGNVEIFTPRGSQWVYAGQTMLARGTAADPEFRIVQAAGPDDWDRWNDSRDRPIATSPSARNVPPGVYGTENLDGYGNWVNVPPYGNVWQPVEPAGWAPYQAGRWVWIDWYGWTWVSYDPWGWAPYHYGRWFYAPPYGWLWYPGAIGVPHYWSPALVAFFGFGGVGVGFGFGNIGWVPLAPYEVLFPWWGRGYYGSPLYFNRSISVLNVDAAYRNARIAGGITAVSGADFRAGRFTSLLRPSAAELTRASFARGPMPVAPDQANLRFSDRQPASIARTAAARTFSYRGNAAASTAYQRVPFAQQQRAFSSLGSAAPANRGWTRFGETSGQSFSPGGWRQLGAAPAAGAQRGEQPAPRGFSRFGEPYAGPRESYSAPRSESRSAAPQQRSYQPSYGARPGGGGAYSQPRSAPRSSEAPSRSPSRAAGGNHGGHRR